MNWELPIISSDAPVNFTELYDFLPPPECQEERVTMRQFMVLLEQGEVPSLVTLEDITEWQCGEKCFIKKCQACSQLGDLEQFTVVRVWYMKRRDQLLRIQQEILKEQEREHHLSELFGRKVTMVGLRRCMKMFRPSVETEVKHLLCPVFSALPYSMMPPTPHSTSEALEAPSVLLKAEELTRKLVSTTFRHLLGGDAQGGTAWTSIEGARAKAALEEVRWLLKDTLISVLAPYGDVLVHKVVFTTAALARDVVRAVFERFEVESSTFYLLNDSLSLDSLEAARKVVTEVMMEKKAKNKPGALSSSSYKERITLTTDAGTEKSCSSNSMERACTTKAIIQDHKDITGLTSADSHTNINGLTASQSESGQIQSDLNLKNIEVKILRPQATKQALEAGLINTRKAMDRASSMMELRLLEEEPLLSINGIYPQESPGLPVTEVPADLCRGETEECCSVAGQEKQDREKCGIRGFLCRMKKLFTCCFIISDKED